MNFLEAVKEMRKGEKVERESWKFICEIESIHILAKWKNGDPYILDFKDYEATDWIVIKKEMSRTQAIELLNGFINLHTSPDKQDQDKHSRALCHQALSVLEEASKKCQN